MKLKKILAVLLVFIGFFGMAFYPAAEIYNAWQRRMIIESMDEQTAKTSDEKLNEMKQQARAWNERLAGKKTEISNDRILDYPDQMALFPGSDLMGWLKIPAISLEMPVYHGTEEATLALGAGHLKSSSLPCKGADTHSVISAHSGMPDQRAFDDIRQLKTGDYFAFKAFDEWIGYRVEKIETVWPDQTDSLKIIPGQDWMSLVTCTPYGINDHRLLVHGKRCRLPEDFFDQKNPAVNIASTPRFLPAVIFSIILSAALIWKLIRHLLKKPK